MGIARIGRRPNGQPGCYLHTLAQTDTGVNYITNKMILIPFAPGSILDWGKTFRAFLGKKQL